MDFDNILQDLLDFQNDVREINEFRSPRVRRRKHYNVRFNPMESLPEDEFKQRYRFSKKNMSHIIEMIRPDLKVDTRGGRFSVDIQVMAAIRYWTRHETQEDCAIIHGMSQQTLSRCANKVAISLAQKSSTYIRMPSNTTEEADTMHKFEAFSGLRGINGAIACTHIKIRKVGKDDQYNSNRKGHSTIKIQVVCDADMKICDIVCNWINDTHDAIIYTESSIKRRFEEDEFSGRLIGDNSYPNSVHLVTPVITPATEEQQNFNYRHSETRHVVERCFGLWKQQFRILREVLRGSYATVKTTIIACAVLHNLSILFGEEHDAAFLQSEDEETEADIVIDDGIAEMTRNMYIENNL